MNYDTKLLVSTLNQIKKRKKLQDVFIRLVVKGTLICLLVHIVSLCLRKFIDTPDYPWCSVPLG